MNSIALVYWSGTGNTEAMAEMIKEAFEAKEADLYYSAVGEADADEFFSKDILILAGPACGTEEIDDSEMLPFIDENSAKFEGRKVFMLGSFGWGGGEFMENWKEIMEDEHQASVPVDPVVCLEAPDSDCEDALKSAAEALLSA